jgi:hypothetical protein
MARTRRHPRKRNPDNKTGLFLLLAAGAAAVFYFYKRGTSGPPLHAGPAILPPPPTPPPAPQITDTKPPAKQPAEPKPVKVKSVPLAAKQKALNAVQKYIANYSQKVNASEPPFSIFTPLVEDGDPGSKTRAALQTVLMIMEAAVKERKRAEDRFQKPVCLWFAWQSEPFFTNSDKRGAAIQAGKPDWYAGDVTHIESLTKNVAPTDDDLWFLYCAARGMYGLSVPNQSSMRDFTG